MKAKKKKDGLKLSGLGIRMTQVGGHETVSAIRKPKFSHPWACSVVANKLVLVAPGMIDGNLPKIDGETIGGSPPPTLPLASSKINDKRMSWICVKCTVEDGAFTSEMEIVQRSHPTRSDDGEVYYPIAILRLNPNGNVWELWQLAHFNVKVWQRDGTTRGNVYYFVAV